MATLNYILIIFSGLSGVSNTDYPTKSPTPADGNKMNSDQANIQITESFGIFFAIIFVPVCIIIILCTVIIIWCMRQRKAKKKARNERKQIPIKKKAGNKRKKAPKKKTGNKRKKVSIQKAAQFDANNKKQPGAGNEKKILKNYDNNNQMHLYLYRIDAESDVPSDIDNEGRNEGDNEWQNEGDNHELQLEGFNELR